MSSEEKIINSTTAKKVVKKVKRVKKVVKQQEIPTEVFTTEDTKEEPVKKVLKKKVKKIKKIVQEAIPQSEIPEIPKNETQILDLQTCREELLRCYSFLLKFNGMKTIDNEFFRFEINQNCFTNSDGELLEEYKSKLKKIYDNIPQYFAIVESTILNSYTVALIEPDLKLSDKMKVVYKTKCDSFKMFKEILQRMSKISEDLGFGNIVKEISEEYIPSFLLSSNRECIFKVINEYVKQYDKDFLKKQEAILHDLNC